MYVSPEPINIFQRHRDPILESQISKFSRYLEKAEISKSVIENAGFVISFIDNILTLNMKLLSQVWLFIRDKGLFPYSSVSIAFFSGALSAFDIDERIRLNNPFVSKKTGIIKKEENIVFMTLKYKEEFITYLDILLPYTHKNSLEQVSTSFEDIIPISINKSYLGLDPVSIVNVFLKRH